MRRLFHQLITFDFPFSGGCAAILVTMVVMTGHLLPTAYAEGANRVKQNTEQLDRIRQRIRGLQQSVNADQKTQDVLSQQLQALEKQVSSLATALRMLQTHVQAQEQKIDETRQDQGERLTRIDKERAVLGSTIRMAYQAGRQERTKLILNQEDPVALGRVLTYYDYINRARTRQIVSIQEQVEALKELEQQLEKDVASLRALKNERRAALDRLESSRVKREATLDSIEAKIRDSTQQLSQLKRDEKAVESLLESLRDLLADIPIDIETNARFTKLKGRLPWPVSGRLLARYGESKLGTQIRWNGHWVKAENGRPVRAVAHGRVAYVGWMHRYGLIVIIEHSDDYYTLYGHNESASTRVGEWVEPGGLIARVGKSGGQKHSGVYFEIRKGKQAVNPSRWLAKK